MGRQTGISHEGSIIMAKKKSNKIPPVILVLICACLLFAMYISLSTIALGLWGQTVMGTVNCRATLPSIYSYRLPVFVPSRYR